MFNKNLLKVFILFIGLSLLFTACASKQKPVEEAAAPVEEITIQQMIRDGRTDEVRTQFLL